MRVIEAAQCGQVRADIAATTGLISVREIGRVVKVGRLKVIPPGSLGPSVAACVLDHTVKWM